MDQVWGGFIGVLVNRSPWAVCVFPQVFPTLLCVVCRSGVKGKLADDDDEEITSESETETGAEKPADSESDDGRRAKRKLKLTEFPDLLAKRHKAYEKHR